jgi:probable rRNA maturation factor
VIAHWSASTRRQYFVMAHGTPARDASRHGFELSLANQQSAHAVDEGALLAAARRVLTDSKFTSATISLAVVDDATIHTLNRQFLEHDYPTDVLSFVLDTDGAHLNGEVVLSADTAATAAAEEGWPAGHEQMLYVIHGVLHLVGLDDQSEADSRNMRAAERFYLQECGVEVPDGFRGLPTTQESTQEPGAGESGRGGTHAW